MQIAAGAEGITCQKLGEAEVMANNGITDIVIATNLIGAARSGRLASLQRRVPLKVCSDNLFSLKAYSDAAREAERPLDVMIECDTGQKRAGVETPREALVLAQVIKEDPMLNFAGLLFYPSQDSWPQTQTFLDEMVKCLGSIGYQPGIVSTGGTNDLSKEVVKTPNKFDPRAASKDAAMGIGWHNNMLRIVANMVAKGRSDIEILNIAEAHTLHGYTVLQTKADI